jgi:hypothetical protein
MKSFPVTFCHSTRFQYGLQQGLGMYNYVLFGDGFLILVPFWLKASFNCTVMKYKHHGYRDRLRSRMVYVSNLRLLLLTLHLHVEFQNTISLLELRPGEYGGPYNHVVYICFLVEQFTTVQLLHSMALM